MATEREWLATKGLAIPGARGRLSKDAHAALAEAKSRGMAFDPPAYLIQKTPEQLEAAKERSRKWAYTNPKPVPAVFSQTPTKPRKPQRVVRAVSPVKFIDIDGNVVESGFCGRCHYRFRFCACQSPIAPTHTVSLAPGQTFDVPFTFKGV